MGLPLYETHRCVMEHVGPTMNLCIPYGLTQLYETYKCVMEHLGLTNYLMVS
jgi:hypothetical protein